MLATDRDALICDLAETYGIFDFRALPVSLLATLSVGLRENSRIKMRMSGEKPIRNEILLAAIADRLSLLVWFMTEDGQNGVNRPESLVEMLLGGTLENSDIETFDSADAFEEEWRRRTEAPHG